MLRYQENNELRQLGLEPSPYVCLQTSKVDAGMCEGTPWVSKVEFLGEGRCVQTFRRKGDVK